MTAPCIKNGIRRLIDRSMLSAVWVCPACQRVMRLRRLIRRIGWLVLALMGSLVGLLWLPMAPFPVLDDTPARDHAKLLTQHAVHEVQVVNHGWHTGVVVHAQHLHAYLPALAERFPTAEWLELGWGDAGFYQAQTITVGITMNALFWPDPAVMHVAGFVDPPEVHFSASERHRLVLVAEDYQRLLRYLASSFVQGPEGRLESLGPGLYGDAQFYGAEGRYSAVNTCNKWTAKALGSAGQPVTVATALTARQVMRALEDAPAVPSR